MAEEIKLNIPTEVIDKLQSSNNPVDKLQKNIIEHYTIKDAMESKSSEQQMINSFFGGADSKIDMTSVTPFEDMYIDVGGEYINRYDTYLKGVDNYERNAQLQTTGSKWSNGLKKAGVNFLTTVAGTTIGSASSVVNWVEEGFDTQALYTDDFNKWLDEVNAKLNYKLPNYISKQEQNENIFEKLDNANFWAKDVAGGVSFTLGSIVGQAIWAGLGTAVSGTKLLSTVSKIGKGVKAAEAAEKVNAWAGLGSKMIRKGFLNVKKANKLTTAKKALETSRFIFTSAGYEAGVEARQMMITARDNFERTLMQQQGRKPTVEERAEFEKKLEDASNGVFFSNLALVGASDLAIYGRLFNIKSPLSGIRKSFSKGINRKIFGIGSELVEEGGEVSRKLLKPSFYQKSLGYTTSILKAPFIEGAWEEGMQSVVSNTADNWLKSGYDINSTQNSYDIMTSIGEAFNESYGSKEGWNNIGVGMIVGLLGGTLSGTITDYNKAIKKEKKYVDIFNNEHVGINRLSHRMFAANQIFKANEDQVEANKRGDFVGERNARKRAMISTIRLNEKFDKSEEAFKDFKTAIDLIDSEQIAEENNISLDEVEEYKTAIINEYKETQDSYKENIEFARNKVGSGMTTSDLGQVRDRFSNTKVNKEWVAEAIAYNITMGEDASKTADLIMEQLLEGLGTFITDEDYNTSIKVRDVLARAEKKARDKWAGLKERRVHIQQLKKDVENEIVNSQKILQRTSSTEENVRIKNNLLSLSEKLEELNSQEESAKRDMELAFKSMQLNSFGERSVEHISVEDMDKAIELKDGEIVGGLLFEIDQQLESLKDSKPKEYNRIKKLANEYAKAIYSMKQFSKTVEGISNENFSPADFTNKLEKIIGKNKSANDFTKEFFANVGIQMMKDFSETSLNRETYETSTPKHGENTNGDDIDTNEYAVVTDDIYKEFKTTGNIPVEIIASISEKVKNNIALTKEEQDIYDNKSTDAEVNRLKSLVDKTLKKNSAISTYTGLDYTEAEKNRVTDSDVSEYKSLLSKLKVDPYFALEIDVDNIQDSELESIGLTKEEISKLKELNSKLSNWQVLSGTLVEGTNTSLSNIIERIALLETDPSNSNVKTTLNSTDAIQIEKVSNKNGGATREDKNMIQDLQGVYVKVDSGTYALSHVSLQGLVLSTGDSVLFNVTKDGLEETSLDYIEKHGKEEGREFVLRVAGQDIYFTIGKRGRLVFSEEAWNDLEPNLDIKFMTSNDTDPSSKSYIMGYTIDQNGSTPAESNFEIETSDKNKRPMMTDSERRNTKEVIAVVDPENKHNKKLIDRYNRAKTDKSKKNARNDLENGVVVYLMKNNKIVGILRGGGLQNLSKSESSVNYGLIRTRAANTLLEGTTSGLTPLSIRIPIKHTFRGAPIFNLEIKNGKPVVKNNPIDSRDMELIVDAGYVENGEIKIKNNTENIVTTYLPKNNQKTPIIIFKFNGDNIAFPVSLNTTTTDLSGRLDAILYSSQTRADKINNINRLLLSIGISPSDYNLNEMDFINSGKIESIRMALSSFEFSVDVNKWIEPSFNLNDLKEQALLPISITDRPFNHPKQKLGLSDAIIREQSYKEYREVLTDEFNDATTKVYPKFMDLMTKRFDYGNDTKLTVFIGNINYDPSIDNNISKQKRFIRDYGQEFLNIKRYKDEFVELHGKDFIEETKKELKTFFALDKKLKNVRDKIKITKELQNKINNEKSEEC